MSASMSDNASPEPANISLNVCTVYIKPGACFNGNMAQRSAFQAVPCSSPQYEGLGNQTQQQTPPCFLAKSVYLHYSVSAYQNYNNKPSKWCNMIQQINPVLLADLFYEYTQKARELLLNKKIYIFLWYSMVSCVLCMRELENDRVTITDYRCFKIVSRLTILERAVLISWELAPSQEITRLMKSTEHWAIGWRATLYYINSLL